MHMSVECPLPGRIFTLKDYSHGLVYLSLSLFLLHKSLCLDIHLHIMHLSIYLSIYLSIIYIDVQLCVYLHALYAIIYVPSTTQVCKVASISFVILVVREVKCGEVSNLPRISQLSLWWGQALPLAVSSPSLWWPSSESDSDASHTVVSEKTLSSLKSLLHLLQGTGDRGEVGDCGEKDGNSILPYLPGEADWVPAALQDWVQVLKGHWWTLIVDAREQSWVGGNSSGCCGGKDCPTYS
jgi:hypothetical protein